MYTNQCTFVLFCKYQHQMSFLMITILIYLWCIDCAQTPCRMWCRCWRSSTWRRSARPWRSRGWCTSASWSRCGSSCRLRRRRSSTTAAASGWRSRRRRRTASCDCGRRNGQCTSLKGSEQNAGCAWSGTGPLGVPARCWLGLPRSSAFKARPG